jgi:hypothetical protein
MPQRPSQDIFAALANAEEAYDDDVVLANYTAAKQQLSPQQSQLRWIETVDIRKAWNGTFFDNKKTKIKGQLIIGDDGVLGFISNNKKKVMPVLIMHIELMLLG